MLAKRKRVILSGVIAVLAMGIAAEAASAVNVDQRILALTGAPAPGTAGAVFEHLDAPEISANGWVAFRATLELGVGDANNSNRFGIWVFDPETEVVALRHRSGDSAPGTPGVFYSFGNPRINRTGELAFNARIAGGNSANDDGVWGPGAGGAISLIAREGDSSPGISGGTFTALVRPLVNDAGRVLLWSNVGGAAGFFESDAGDPVELLYGAGDLIPGSGGLEVLGGSPHQALNQSGNAAMVVYSGVGEPDVTTANNGFLVGPDGQGGFRFIAREGDPAPGLPGVFLGDVADGPVLTENDAVGFLDPQSQSVWLSAPGQPLQLIAGPGSPIVGTADVVTAAGGTAKVSMNESLEFAFLNWGSCQAILFADAVGDIHRVADCSDTVPGRPASHFEVMRETAINENGTIAFSARFDFDLNGNFDNGVFVAGFGPQVGWVVGSGDTILVAPSDERTVVDVDLRVEEYGSAFDVLSDGDQLAYRLYFNDQSHALVLATLTPQAKAVPTTTPGASAILVLGLLFGGVAALSRRLPRNGPLWGYLPE